MLALLQRVTHARVDVAGETLGRIEQGILVFLGVERGDNDSNCDKLARKVLNYRIFPDSDGRMNRSVADIAGGILVISQFTLAADTGTGLRPSFTPAAPPAEADVLYRRFVDQLRSANVQLATGRFGANMQVSLCNDGPVTFLLADSPATS